jgi:hypothetical protein
MIENLLGKLLHLFLARHFFEHRILQQLLLNEISQLERRHLQHLDALAQLRRQYESLGEAGS